MMRSKLYDMLLTGPQNCLNFQTQATVALNPTQALICQQRGLERNNVALLELHNGFLQPSATIENRFASNQALSARSLATAPGTPSCKGQQIEIQRRSPTDWVGWQLCWEKTSLRCGKVQWSREFAQHANESARGV